MKPSRAPAPAPGNGLHRGLALLLWLLLAALLAGCACPTEVDASGMHPESAVAGPVVVHKVGGTHYRTVIHGGLWYQTFGNALLTLDTKDGSLIHRLEFGPAGEVGPATDLILQGRRLFVVLQDDAVVEVSLASPRRPRTGRIVEAAELGILPRRLSAPGSGVGGEPVKGKEAGGTGGTGSGVFVSGKGGAVRLADGAAVFKRDGEVGPVVMADGGLVATFGRRAFRAEDDHYLGSASELTPLPKGCDLPGAFAFVRRGDDGDEVGLMNADLREVSTEKATVRTREPVARIRVFDRRLWIITASEVRGYLYRGGELKLASLILIPGVSDVDLIDENHLAICGRFGRGIYRRWKDAEGRGRIITFAHREPTALMWAQFDGRHVLAGGLDETWLYPLKSPARRTDDRPDDLPEPTREAASLWASARIADDGRSVMISTMDGEMTYVDPNGAEFFCAAAVDGTLWLGHARGITVFRGRGPNAAEVIGQLRLDGPVRFIFPLLKGGGAAYVCENGGMGVAECERGRR